MQQQEKDADPGRKYLAAFSGGLDSTVLLRWLKTTRPEQPLRAIHIHHGLHSDASVWSRRCQDFCDSLGVELIIVKVKVARDAGQGVEAAAREARYAAFAEHLGAGETLVLAHHQDDQAETVLLRLLRAAGSTGLSAMQPRRPFGTGVLWRPLLPVPRSALLDYANVHRLRWIDDPSNRDLQQDRNFLRHRVLPLLAERWPQAAKALAKSAELLAEDVQLLEREAEQRLALTQGLDPATLSVSHLLGWERPWRSRILLRWLSQLGLPPLPGHGFEIIETQLLPARGDAQPEYRWANIRLRRWRGLLQVEPMQAGLPSDWQCQWHGQERLQLPTGDRLVWLAGTGAQESELGAVGVVKAMPMPLTVRARRGGERIILPERAHSHALKQLLQALGIPPWERERLPLLFAEDGELLAAGDLLVSARLERLCRERRIRLVWERHSKTAEGTGRME